MGKAIPPSPRRPARVPFSTLLPLRGNKKQEFWVVGCMGSPRWYLIAASRQ
jgi:hypothetical protein